MAQSVSAPVVRSQPTIISDGERQSLAAEIKQSLLALASRSSDSRIQQLRKALLRGDNRAHDTTAAILTDAFNSKREDPQTFLSAISGFLSSRTHTVGRKWKELRGAETRVEGKMNCTELEIDQGDGSTARKLEMKAEIREYRTILDEEDAALDAELYTRAAL